MSAAASRLAGLALPPADRPPGRRGLRGALALALLAGGVLALFADRYASSGSSGTGVTGTPGTDFSYTFAGPAWLHVALPVLAVATVVASVLSAAGFAFAAEARLAAPRSASAVPALFPSASTAPACATGWARSEGPGAGARAGASCRPSSTARRGPMRTRAATASASRATGSR